MPAAEPSISLEEFAARRADVLRSIGRAVGLVFAGEATGHVSERWRPHPHFEYLTGITDEPGAMLLFDGTNPVEDRRVQLFLRPLNIEVEKWDGYRDEIGSRLRARTGIKTIFRTTALGRWLTPAVIRAKHLACLHPLAAHAAPVSLDLELFRRAAERVPGCAIEDRSDVIALMRSAKSAAEVRLLQRAADITARGYDAVLQSLKPGMTEFDVQETIEHAYKSHGSRGTTYGTIAGAGRNSTVLHYHANDQPLHEGDLICIDSAASFGGYTADVTRTFPVSGWFTPRQREVYDVVLKAELAAIAAVKAGATIARIDKAARDVIEKAGFGDAFIHGIGHHLGLEVHDVTPVTDDALRPGAVITIEPGVYLPDEKIGVRIEDDVVVTRTGCKVLTASIPKKAADIEAAMRGR
jgi:Xaa-Pro aminopeptidase